jgi:hypothetical protein
VGVAFVITCAADSVSASSSSKDTDSANVILP